MPFMSSVLKFLALLSGPWLFLCMILLPLNWEDIFAPAGALTWMEIFIYFSFMVFFLVDVALFLLTWGRLNSRIRFSTGTILMRTLSLLGVITMGITLVIMIQIGRESSLGWDSRGEFVLLIAALLIHLALNLFYMTVVDSAADDGQLTGSN